MEPIEPKKEEKAVDFLGELTDFKSELSHSEDQSEKGDDSYTES